MDIHDYTESIKGTIKSYPHHNDMKYGSDIFLSLLDNYIPQNSLVFIGGRPRTGKTSLSLDFIARNSLLQKSPEKANIDKTSPKNGLVYIIGHKEHIILLRWISIATQSFVEFRESAQFLNYTMDNYKNAIEGAKIDLKFLSSVDELFPIIESDMNSLDPDYIVIDGINTSASHEINQYQAARHLDKLIKLQKKTEKFFLISTCLGHEAYHRGGAHKHILEDINSTQIESEADIALLLHRPELYGIECDEEGYSLKGIVEIETAINRYGNEGKTTYWHDIHVIPKFGQIRAMMS